MMALFVIPLLWNLLGPAPPGIVINPETKECGYYWGGDEWANYDLPSPWIINYGEPIETELGVFEWDGGDIESFCKQIGYTYVSGNLGDKYGKYRWTWYSYLVLAIKFAPLIIFSGTVFFALFLFLRWANKRSSNTPNS
jgi:hypothetical protein